MNKIKKPLIGSLIAFTLVNMIFLQGTVVSGTVISGPINVLRPQGTLEGQFRNNMLWLIRNMNSANFTPDNVYYGIYDSTGNYNYPVNRADKRNISLDLTILTDLLNTTIKNIESNPFIENETKDYLKNLYSELEIHQTLKIYHEVNSDLQIVSSHDRKAITIFYDNDRSVLDALNKIKNNETLSSQPFSGDEILTNVFLSLIKDEILGTYQVTNQWSYEDDSNANLLKDFINRVMKNRIQVRELRFFYKIPAFNIMCTLALDNINANTGLNPKIFKHGTFSVSQLRIDKLDLIKMGSGIIIDDYEYKYMEHHLLGSLIYNDTNENGYMDIGVKNTSIGGYDITYPTIGDEAKYRFDIEDIATRIYYKPVSNNNVLEFGSKFEDVQGYLQPITRNRDISLFNVTTDSLHSINEVSTMFHFEVDNTLGSIALKFDYTIGNWDNAAELEGLAFNQLMVSTIVDAKKQKTYHWRNENNNELLENFENASHISQFKFADDLHTFGEIRLDDIPYTWDNSEEVNAVGQLIPMSLIDITYGHISSDADMIRAMRGSVDRKTFIYSVSYPKWEGKSIVHDPTFTVIGGEGSETDTGGVIPGFEFTSVILSIPVVALIEVYRRKRR